MPSTDVVELHSPHPPSSCFRLWYSRDVAVSAWFTRVAVTIVSVLRETEANSGAQGVLYSVSEYEWLGLPAPLCGTTLYR